MQGFGEIKQIAYLTDDIDKSMQSWMEKSGVGPFACYEKLTLVMDYLGERQSVDLRVGIAFRGDMQIELIQQVNDAPSPYRAFFERGQLGLHHLAYVTQDITKSLEYAKSKGFEVIATIENDAGRYAYFQDSAMPEVFYELLEVPAELQAYWDESIAAAKTWDGTPHVERMDMGGHLG